MHSVADVIHFVIHIFLLNGVKKHIFYIYFKRAIGSLYKRTSIEKKLNIKAVKFKKPCFPLRTLYAECPSLLNIIYIF